MIFSKKEKNYQNPRLCDNLFHIAVGPVIIFGNLFGIMPVSGVLSNDVSRVKFRWLTLKTVFSICVIVLGSLEVATAAHRTYRSGFKLYSFGEHILYLNGAFTNSKLQIEKCNFTFGIVENMYRRERAHYFDLVYFEIWMTPIVAWLQLSLTMCWTFIDTFISVSSITIAFKFKLITERLQVTKTKVMPQSFWMDIRHDYAKQTDLVFYLDDQFSAIILLACTNGLYVTCLQLFNISMERPSTMDQIFSWFSLVFLISRTLAMLFFASTIHDASKEPLAILRDIPTKYWTLEVQRFASEISHQTIAFSGKQFFFITRKLIFAMIGTVVTYELVLLDRIDEYSDITDFLEKLRGTPDFGDMVTKSALTGTLVNKKVDGKRPKGRAKQWLYDTLDGDLQASQLDSDKIFEVLPPEYWDDQRKYYTALSELMSTVDEKIGIITLISFSMNLYYVCLQLFNSVIPSDTFIRALYFWYSLCFLIGRTVAVSFFASRIHDESKKPIEEMRLIPTAAFTKETKRLLEQVTNSTIALSGFNFFYVTRQFILNVAGTIVTYELVLVQLHKGESGPEDPCAR
ncbi:gustatory receptor for sugar taste 64c-like [Hermetia illucens]|uniref:gustatory receptor for sugar taste 64c-like n=1 Tax=Hermetia illucens TaxID=343691 RepID=UPI0018CC735B|nr:gustatory receptor for sugar taste 64c-like [Hermetia illucens]